MILKRATDDPIRAIYNSHNENTSGTGTIAASKHTTSRQTFKQQYHQRHLQCYMETISRSNEKVRASGIYESMIYFLQRELMSTTLATLFQTKRRGETKAKLKLYNRGRCLYKVN